MFPPEPPKWPPKPSDRYRVGVATFDENGITEHDLGEVRIREGEVGHLYLAEDGVPFVAVIPECEA